MSKHTVQVAVNTNDNKALRIVREIMQEGKKRKGKHDAIWETLGAQLRDLQTRVEHALLDLDTSLVEEHDG